MSAYRPEFEAALRLFARASEAMHARGFQRPILVGGAAAEFYSQSAITTGDFDLCTFRQRLRRTVELSTLVHRCLA